MKTTMERNVTPDTLIFDLVEKLACISVSQDGHAKFLVGNDLHDITDTNLGRWLLEIQGWGLERPLQPFQWPEASGSIQ
jgi:hypothetical protein